MKDFDDAYISKFRSCQNTVEQEAHLCHMIAAKQARELQRATQTLQEEEKKNRNRRQQLNLLSMVDYGGHHRKLQKLRHHGTGTWLTEVQNFSSWQESGDSGCFCCFGIPGSGKTILVSHTIDSMSSSYQEVVSAIYYYYYDYANIKALEASSVVGAMTRQLLEQIEIPMEVAKDIDPTTVLEMLRRLTQLQSITVKAIVFSRREEKLIRQAFKNGNSVDISADLVRKDII